jgi:hypothetical protein
MKQDSNWASERWESTHAREARKCEKFIRHFPKEIDMHRLRIGKTIYCFDSIQRLKAKLKQLDTCEYDYAPPGDELPVKKLKL